MTRRAITLDGERVGAPFIIAECNDTGWNGYHVPYLTAQELADHVAALKEADPDGWGAETCDVMTVSPEGIIMRTEGGDDLWRYTSVTDRRAWVDGLTWVTATDDNGEPRSAAPTVAETVAAIKAEVLSYMADGSIPATVTTFSELHDYCDANVLGGMCDEGFPESFGPQSDGTYNDAWMSHCNAAQDEVDAWLKSRRHYVVGLPVTVTVDDDGLVTYTVHAEDAGDLILNYEGDAAAWRTDITPDIVKADAARVDLAYERSERR